MNYHMTPPDHFSRGTHCIQITYLYNLQQYSQLLNYIIFPHDIDQ